MLGAVAPFIGSSTSGDGTGKDELGCCRDRRVEGSPRSESRGSGGDGSGRDGGGARSTAILASTHSTITTATRTGHLVVIVILILVVISEIYRQRILIVVVLAVVLIVVILSHHGS